MKNLRFTLKCTLLLSALLLTGCGGTEATPMANVSGVVMLDGKPLTNGSIRFDNPSVGSAGFPLDEDGAFKSNFPIRAASYQVAIDYPTDRPPGGPLTGDLAKVPDHMWSLKDSGLSATVVTTAENTFEFSISSDAKAPPGFKGKPRRSTTPPPPPGIENK